jgi:AcrR family transcriptional regulator
MAPDDRRAALIAATIPLLRAHGTTVSTRQIAEAAGVAEGTIFRVFPDKSSLIRAAVLSAFDPEPTLKALIEIDPEAPMRERLKAIAGVLSDRVGDIHVLMGLLRTTTGVADPHEFREQLMHSALVVREAIAERLQGDAGELRRSPTVVAHLLSSIISSTRRGGPFPVPGEPFIPSDEVVDLLLDGLLVIDVGQVEGVEVDLQRSLHTQSGHTQSAHSQSLDTTTDGDSARC